MSSEEHRDYRFVGGPHDGFWDCRPAPVREVVEYLEVVCGRRRLSRYRVRGRDLVFGGSE